MNKTTEKYISWTDFKKNIVNQISSIGNVVVITYRGEPQLKVTAFVQPCQKVSLRHVAWQIAREFDLWSWRGLVPCIITMGQRKTPVAVVERWNEENHTPGI